MAFGSPVFPLPSLDNGIEVDMLSLGDADSIIVTKYENGNPHRILIDGGSGKSAEIVIDFMLRRKLTEFCAAICTHAHNDHASGLVKIVQDKRIEIRNAIVNDLRYHIQPDALRRASAASDGVKEVVDTTKELSAAFTERNIPIYRGLAGDHIAKWPNMRVLGPSLDFYKSTLEDFTKVDLPIPFSSLASIIGGSSSSSFGLAGIRAPYPLIPSPPSTSPVDLSALLTGALSRSTVQEEPKTQPFNNTSMILGVEFAGQRLLFTADAGSEALDRIPPEWKNLTWMQVPHHGSDGNLSKSNIERFCPRFAFISACGDSSHPSRAIVNGLIKCGAEVCSTHSAGHLWYYNGTVPARLDYGKAITLNATGDQKPINWADLLMAGSR